MKTVTLVCGLLFSFAFFGAASLGDEDKVPEFTDVTIDSGVRFTHISGPKESKNHIPEAKGGGVGFFDYNNDGWLDLVLVQGSTVERFGRGSVSQSKLFLNNTDGTFEDVTEQAGLRHKGWGMGVCIGDFDNDGFADVYITGRGPNALFPNNCNGSFTDITDKAGVGDPRWSASAAFGDYDKDGFLDLYVANYLNVNFDSQNDRLCHHRGFRVFCGPRDIPGAGDVLFRNNGNGTFSDVTEEAGTVDRDRYFGLGVVWGDVDNDNDLDIYVANDMTPNLLFVNNGNGTFEEMGLVSGLAYNVEGVEQSSMGVDLSDYDNDGLLDAYVTHFSNEYSTLYHNRGGLLFEDVTGEARLFEPEVPLVSWGTRLVDFNNDGWKDIFHSNGHVYPCLIGANLEETYYQAESLYVNSKDGTFENASDMAGKDIQKKTSSRGVAFGDYDNDGDVDLAIVTINDSPRLLRTDRRDQNHWLMFKTVGRKSNRDGIGARIRVVSGELTQIGEIKRTVGIYSASDPRAHFGLGSAHKADLVEIQWPSGKSQRFKNVHADTHYVLDEEKGLRKEFPEVFR